MAFLVQSLGGTARIRTKPTSYVRDGERLRVQARVSHERDPAARHPALQTGSQSGDLQAASKVPALARRRRRHPVGRKPAQCITVDSPDGLYVTDHCIVTHNTAQLIALLLRGPTRPTLVICPTSVVGNWRHELARFAPALKVLVHHGPSRARARSWRWRRRQHDVVLSTYSLLHRDEASLARVRWDGAGAGRGAERQERLDPRGPGGARDHGARWRVALTGTPVENRLADLWSIFQVINPGYLGSAEEFRREFALPIERASDADATARLKALTAPFILRRVKTDRSVIADLPDKQEMKVYCSLTREQATLYEAVAAGHHAPDRGVRRHAAPRPGPGPAHAAQAGLQSSRAPAARRQRRWPVARASWRGWARCSRRSSPATSGRWSSPSTPRWAACCRTTCAKRSTARCCSCTAARRWPSAIAWWPSSRPTRTGRRSSSCRSRRAAPGSNLTRANHVFHFDRWWNPAVENQATDRAFRIGQTRNVQVHKYVCAGTFEETLDELIERKVALAESIVGTSEAWITEMSTDELRELFRLRREEAVTEDEA